MLSTNRDVIYYFCQLSKSCFIHSLLASYSKKFFWRYVTIKDFHDASRHKFFYTGLSIELAKSISIHFVSLLAVVQIRALIYKVDKPTAIFLYSYGFFYIVFDFQVTFHSPLLLLIMSFINSRESFYTRKYRMSQLYQGPYFKYILDILTDINI